jgi:putrescine aminotransferase
VAHHLPAQSSYGLQVELGGSRIITHATGSTIVDAEGKRMLDGMAGLWCVNVGYGRRELAEAAYAQMELPFYNTFFKTATPPPVLLAARLAGLLGASFSMCSSTIPDRNRTTPSSAWCAPTGR